MQKLFILFFLLALNAGAANLNNSDGTIRKAFQVGNVTLSDTSEQGAERVEIDLQNVGNAGQQIMGLQTQILGKANLASPTFTGTPTAPTAAAGTNTTQLATTAFVTSAVSGKANLASPTFTGTPAAPTAAAGTNTTQLATTAFVTSAVAAGGSGGGAPLASPAFTGTPTAPTATAGTNTTQLATTAFVTAAANLKANLASPTFTGTPAAPTAAAGTNTTQLATTAFVTSAIAAAGGGAIPLNVSVVAASTNYTSSQVAAADIFVLPQNSNLVIGLPPSNDPCRNGARIFVSSNGLTGGTVSNLYRDKNFGFDNAIKGVRVFMCVNSYWYEI